MVLVFCFPTAAHFFALLDKARVHLNPHSYIQVQLLVNGYEITYSSHSAFTLLCITV